MRACAWARAQTPIVGFFGLGKYVARNKTRSDSDDAITRSLVDSCVCSLPTTSSTSSSESYYIDVGRNNWSTGLRFFRQRACIALLLAWGVQAAVDSAPRIPRL